MVRAAGADVLISVGGGSPIDSAKAVAYRIHEQTGVWIPSIAVPTTLSVAETTQNAGFTTEELKKIAVSHPELVPKGNQTPRDLIIIESRLSLLAIIYDGDIALYTPLKLWTSTGVSISSPQRNRLITSRLDSRFRSRSRTAVSPFGI
jgi:3-oxoacid CoA-transferase